MHKIAMIVIIVVLGLVPGPGFAIVTHYSPTRIAAIEALVSERMDVDQIPGVSVVLVEKGKIVHTFARGIVGPSGESVTPETIFALASVSKSFTGLAILQLAKEGQLRFDDPVIRYLPWFRTKNPEWSSQITIRNLLNHTSGLSTHIGNNLLDDRGRSPSALEVSVRRLANVDLVAEPGTAFNYSNDNYRILGLILQEAENAPYEQVIANRIFKPLHIRTARFFGIGEPGVAVPHRYWWNRPQPHLIPLGSSNSPEAGIYASANDMGAYLIALTGGNEIIPNFWSPAVAKGPMLGSGNRYSIGFESHGPIERPLLLHGGWNAGFMARIGIDPMRRIGVAIMTNASSGFITGDIDLMTKGVLSIALETESPAPKSFLMEHVLLAITLGLMIAIVMWMAMLGYRFHTTKIKIQRTAFQLFVKCVVPSLPLVAIPFASLWMLPHYFETTSGGILLFQPDLGWMLIALASLSLFWCMLRLMLLLCIHKFAGKQTS